VAIVGHTGAGKTTLTSLMMRFYDVTAGQILVDGVDLREQDLTALRQHFAVVLQDPFLFTGTLAENIRFGNEAITDAGLRQAARDVNVLDFIESLPGNSTSRCRSAATRSPPARSSSSTLPARWPTIRASSSSTRPRRAWTPTPNCASAARWSAWSRAGPAC
jgi:ABC-type uncharacterized transport system fused permease/ATPase subunit